MFKYSMVKNTKKMAGQLAEQAVPTASTHQTAGELWEKLKCSSSQYETVDYIYILDNKKLIGVISLHELLSLEPDTLLSSKMTTPVVSVRKGARQEKVAHTALAENIKAVPVVDKQGDFFGVVTSDTILQVLRDEHTEDVLKYAGLSVETGAPAHHFTFKEHYLSRLPWLILGLGGGVLAAWVVEMFSETIINELVLASFIPAIVYIADAVGSQTQMVYVRSLANSHRPKLLAALAQELSIATAVGTTLSLLILFLSWFWLHNAVVSTILTIAVFTTVYFSVLVAVLLPWFFTRINKDPAVASGPLATVIRDISSLFIYFGIAVLFL
jgi:magnesium transporter